MCVRFHFSCILETYNKITLAIRRPSFNLSTYCTISIFFKIVFLVLHMLWKRVNDHTEYRKLLQNVLIIFLTYISIVAFKAKFYDYQSTQLTHAGNSKRTSKNILSSYNDSALKKKIAFSGNFRNCRNKRQDMTVLIMAICYCTHLADIFTPTPTTPLLLKYIWFDSLQERKLLRALTASVEIWK